MNNIPIFINNFNRITTTKKLVEDLRNLGYNNITIIDNKSTYVPLLRWYNTNPCRVRRLDVNMQSYALWDCGEMSTVIAEPWIVYTDSDIELNENTPSNFIELLIEKAELYHYTKAGLALKIDDLPENVFANHIRHSESKFWLTELESGVYSAHVDTTFCVIKPTRSIQYDSLRLSCNNLTAKHIPWYTDFNNLTEEESYYLDQSGDYSSYKRFYRECVKNKKPNE